jgi:hypothetical protein
LRGLAWFFSISLIFLSLVYLYTRITSYLDLSVHKERASRTFSADTHALLT